jgi:hypothetical protein
LNICEDSERSGSHKEKIFRVLLESQGYSIECKRKERKEIKKNQSFKKDGILKCLNGDQFYHGRQEYINKAKPACNMNRLNHSIALSSEDKIIFRTKDIFSAAICLLNTASKQKSTNNNTIIISYYNDVEIALHPYNYLLLYFRDLLLKAINNGWNVLFLLKI